MKAISVRQLWASMIADGTKTIETRTWPTKYRGDLLIVSSARPVVDDLPAGKALCVVNLADCRPMTKADEQRAQCRWYNGAWAWVLENIRPVSPVHLRGALGIYEVEDELIAINHLKGGDK